MHGHNASGPGRGWQSGPLYFLLFFQLVRVEIGGEGGIDSSLRSSPCGRTPCVQIGCADLSNPLVDYRGFEYLNFLKVAWTYSMRFCKAMAERVGFEPTDDPITTKYATAIVSESCHPQFAAGNGQPQ